MAIYHIYIDLFLIWYLWSTFTQNIAPVYLIDYPSFLGWKKQQQQKQKQQQHIHKKQVISTNNMTMFWQTIF